MAQVSVHDHEKHYDIRFDDTAEEPTADASSWSKGHHSAIPEPEVNEIHHARHRRAPQPCTYVCMCGLADVVNIRGKPVEISLPSERSFVLFVET